MRAAGSSFGLGPRTGGCRLRADKRGAANYGPRMKTVRDFIKQSVAGDGDRRLEAPGFQGNGEAICEVVSELLGGKTGDVVEVGSGSGQHAALLASRLPGLSFWPSDYSEAQIGSINAWRRHAQSPNLMPATKLDVLWKPWRIAGRPFDDRSLAAVLCINLIHIAAWEVALAVLQGSAPLLRPDGFLMFYGPFRRDDVQTAPSIAAYDDTLRSHNPAWGVPDLDELTAAARDAGLERHAVFDMPANNLMVAYRPAGGAGAA